MAILIKIWFNLLVIASALKFLTPSKKNNNGKTIRINKKA